MKGQGAGKELVALGEMMEKDRGEAHKEGVTYKTQRHSSVSTGAHAHGESSSRVGLHGRVGRAA